MLEKVGIKIADYMKPVKQNSAQNMRLQPRRDEQPNYPNLGQRMKNSRGSNNHARLESVGNQYEYDQHQDIEQSDKSFSSNNENNSNVMKSSSVNKASLNCSTDSILKQDVHFDQNHQIRTKY